MSVEVEVELTSGNRAANGSEMPACEQERRAETRRAVRHLSEIQFAGSRERITCLVHDVSGVGAQIETSASDLPARFVLVDYGDGSRALCETVWRRGRRMGVRFLKPRRVAR